MTRAHFTPVTLILAVMCIQWVSLGSAGPFSMKVPYVMLGLGILYAGSSPRRIAACLNFIRQNALWIMPFTIYLVLVTATLHGSRGEASALRQLFYLLGSIAFAGSLAVTPNIPAVLRTGTAIALTLFFVLVEILARTIGSSWIDVIREFLQSGNLRFVVVDFFRAAFNALDPSGETTVDASQKNGVAVCVLVAALLFRSGSARPSRDLVGTIVLGLALALLFLLNTRSVLIVAGLSILLAIAVSAMTRPMRRASLMMKGLTAVVVIIVAVGYTEVESPAFGTISDRFAFEDTSTASRVEQYEAAAEMIEKHPFIGNGYFELRGKPIHNLFLSAWVHAGLAAFLLVVAFYLALLHRWLSVLWAFVTYPERWVIPIAFEWVAALPILPLFRVWLSGDSGHPFLGEWMALAAFLGIVLANDLKLRSATVQRAAKVAPRPIAPASAGSAA